MLRAGLAIVFLLCTAAPSRAQESLRPAIAARYPGVRWVNAATLEGWMRQRPSLVLLDARTPAEYAVSRLRGARRIDPERPQLSGVPEGRVVVYCSVGWRSAAVANALQHAGHSEVYNLEGGIFGWANHGRPLYRGVRRVHVVHPYDALWGRLLDRALHAESR